MGNRKGGGMLKGRFCRAVPRYFVPDLLLDVLDGVRRLDIKGDGLAGEGLHEDLHSSEKRWHRVRTTRDHEIARQRKKGLQHEERGLALRKEGWGKGHHCI